LIFSLADGEVFRYTEQLRPVSGQQQRQALPRACLIVKCVFAFIAINL